MLKFILNLFKGSGHQGQKSTVRRWTETEPNRVRTYEETTELVSSGGISVSISATTELATSRQEDFLFKLGFSQEGLTKGDASYLLDRILRPVDYALRKTFRNIDLLEKEHLRALQVAIVHWEYYPQLPRYGPHATWNDLEASGNDPNRPLTKEERMAITDIAFKVLPPQTFRGLESNGLKKYKGQLDGTLSANS